MTDFLLSMTGYGEATRIINDKEWRCVVQSVNSRHLDCRCRLPNQYQSLEPAVRDQVKKSVERGKVDVTFSLVSVEESSDRTLLPDNYFNVSWVSGFCRAGEQLVDSLNWPKSDPLYSALIQSALARREAFDTSTVMYEGSAEQLSDLLKDALFLHLESRRAEGTHLAADMRHRISLLDSFIKQVQTSALTMPQIFKERIEQRLAALLVDSPVTPDEARLCQEIAFLVDKADISEEIVRFKSHLAQFLNELELESSKRKGKKLEFIVQEMLREINTIGSKANLLEITRNVVDAKNELEKIREQVQNVI